MSKLPFPYTVAGRRFFERSVPDAVAALDRLNATLVELINAIERTTRPSRRRSAPTAPGSVHTSASRTMRSLHSALNTRRVARSRTSGSGSPPLAQSCRIVTCVADEYAIVRADRSRYSVPSELTRRALLAKIVWDRIEIVHDDRWVAVHGRSYVEGAHVLDAQHVLVLLENEHRVISEATAIAQMQLAPVFRQLRVALRGKVPRGEAESPRKRERLLV